MRTSYLHAIGLLAVTLALCVCAYGQSLPRYDWKLFGLQGKDSPWKVRVEQFYLSNEIRRLPNGHLRVWIEALGLKAVRNVHFGKKEIAHLAVRALIYVPPFSRIQKLSRRDQIGVVTDEAAADKGTIPPKEKILFELNCTNQKYRMLDMQFLIAGHWRISNTPTLWDYIPPETSLSSLATLICPPQK